MIGSTTNEVIEEHVEEETQNIFLQWTTTMI